ncbi:MAG TPA: hypothetical protein VF765_34510 [Polyangiaceae bacterium]
MNPPPEPTPTPCSGGSGLGDSCPAGPDPTQGCATPKLGVNGQPFLSNNPIETEEAEYAVAVSHPAQGAPRAYIAATHDFLSNVNSAIPGKSCVIRKTLDVWTSQNTLDGQQGDWTQINLPASSPTAMDWFTDPALAVDSDGYVYLAGSRTDVESDCSTDNALNDVANTRIWLFVAGPGDTTFTGPLILDTEGTPALSSFPSSSPGVDHPRIAANPKIPGQLVVTYIHEDTGSSFNPSDKVMTLQRMPGTTNFQSFTRNGVSVNWQSLCSIEPAHNSIPDTCSTTENNVANDQTMPRVEFSESGDLFLVFNTGSVHLWHLTWDATNSQWNTVHSTNITLSGAAILGDANDNVNFPNTQLGGGEVQFLADPSPGLAVGTVAENSDPVVWVTFDADPTGTGNVGTRQLEVVAVDGFSDLSLSKFKGPFAIPGAFHGAVSLFGPANVTDVIYMKAADTGSLSSPIQTFVQRFDATRFTTVGGEFNVSAAEGGLAAPTLDDLPARHGSGGGTGPSSLFIGDYMEVGTLGINGFTGAAPVMAQANGGSPGQTNVQAALNLGSQRCDPPAAIPINRSDALWQCDNCDCGSDGLQPLVGCVPGSVTDPAVACAVVCGGTACGRSLSCSHDACAASGSPSATVLAPHSCNVNDGKFAGSEPSDFADYVATDDGTSTVTLAKSGHSFTTPSPGNISFNFSESPPHAGREIEISRINLTPDSFKTPEIDVCIPILPPICFTVEPAHDINDLRLTHGQRVYGVFTDDTHFQVPAGAANFFGSGADGSTPAVEFQSNTAPLVGTFDPIAGTFTLSVTVGDPTQDGAAATFNGKLTRSPSYDCAAGIPPVFSPSPLPPILVEPCYEGATVAIPIPGVDDLCTPHHVLVSGKVVSVNGVALSTPIPVVDGLLTVSSGQLDVRWTATDANGTTATADQTVVVRAAPALFAEGSLAVDHDASVITPTGVGAVLDNGGAASSSDTALRSGSASGPIASVPSVKLIGATVQGSVQSGGAVSELAGATVSGVVTTNSSPSLPSFPSVNVTFPPSAGDVDVATGSQTALAPGSYGNVDVRKGGTLVLKAGSYFFQRLHVWPDATVQLDTKHGVVNVYVESFLLYEGQTASNGDPSRFVLGYLGSTPALMHSSFTGVVIAPNASLQLAAQPNGAFKGAFFAMDIEVFPGVQVTQAPFACIIP